LKDGACLFIEYKRPGERPTEAQLKEHEKIRDKGFVVYVIDNIIDGQTIFKEAKC